VPRKIPEPTGRTRTNLITAYATGTPDGVRSWLRHYAAAVSAGADEIAEIGDAVLTPSGT